VAVGGQIWQVPLEAWHWVFGVNFWGVVHGVKSFVPLLIEQGEGHVVNTASAAGLMSTPYLGPYGCTKHAVVSLSETLFHELGGTDIGVSVLCPLWVKTRIHESDRNAPEGFAALSPVAGAPPETMRDIVAGLIASGLEPSVVAAKVVDAVKTNDFYVLPHDEVRGIARHRGETIAEGGKPSLAPLA
jgi:short-subunit dehydrogenase